MKVSCSKCGNNIRRVRSKKGSSRKVVCFDCFELASYETLTKNNPPKTSQTKFEVGDDVFVNTGKYGVVKCLVLNAEIIEGFKYYDLDVKGKEVTYVSEDMIGWTYFQASGLMEVPV